MLAESEAYDAGYAVGSFLAQNAVAIVALITVIGVVLCVEWLQTKAQAEPSEALSGESPVGQ